MRIDDRQLSLFDQVAAVYAAAEGAPITNEALYAALEARGAVTGDDLEHKQAIGAAGAMHSPAKRKIRWFQQTLRRLGLIERAEERGVWRLAEKLRDDLHRAADGVGLVAFSTELGVAIWANNRDVFPHLDEPISLCISSPPYPLRQARAYGNPAEHEYVDFICTALEPIVRGLKQGGSVVLNLSNDIFEHKSPARSLYLERLTIALHDRLGLHLMERSPWVNYSKPPQPTYWACVKPIHLSSAYEHLLWYTNDPHQVQANNRNLLTPHTARHQRLIDAGGAGREVEYGDGAYKIRKHSYGNATAGKLPRNVYERGHVCPDTQAYREHAKALGLPCHGAMFPTDIPDRWIRHLTQPGDLVVDLFGGTAKTGLAAERLGRRWLVVEWVLQYLRPAAELFRQFDGFELEPAMLAVGR